MSPAIHFVTQNVPGYGLTDVRFLPCSGVSGRTVSSSPCFSCGPYKTLSYFKTAPLKCTSRGMSSLCNYRRNPGSFRQNKGSFSQNRNDRQNDERDGSESLEESDDIFSSKNGALTSSSNPPSTKFQATSTPGPREKGIVELFKQIQAKLREKEAAKAEMKKIESTQPRGKEDAAVDSLLELLRKHPAQKGKTSSSSGGSSRDFSLDEPESDGPSEKGKSMDLMLDQSERNGTFEREESTTLLDSNNNVKGKAQARGRGTMTSLDSNNRMKGEAQGHGPDSPTFTRPVSKFQRRSPIPQVKYQPIPSDSVTDTWINGKSERIHPDPEINDPRIDVMLEEEYSDIDEGYSDDEVEEEKPILDEDLNAMKLQDLRAIAKSRGLKRFSRLKKSELVEMLSGGST